MPLLRKLLIRVVRLSVVLLVLGAGSCARQPLPLAEDPQLAGADPWLAPDLEAASRDLPGEFFLDVARLRLIEGQEAEARPLAGGWLLSLRREWTGAAGGAPESQALLVWLGAGAQRGVARLLARGDSLTLLRQGGEKGAEGLLVLRRFRQAGLPQRSLLVVDGAGRGRVLAKAPADRLRWAEGALHLAEEGEAPAFRERTGCWHLERRLPLRGAEGAWRLGPAESVDSPYRALSEFLDAARRGRWGRARERANLPRLLALPDGRFSTELKASLKAGSPELLDRRFFLAAPGPGPIMRLEDPAGRLAWRVGLERLPDARGRARWTLVRLERVVG